MYENGPFATPVGSFMAPTEPPDVDPDSSPTCTVTLSQDWVPYVIGSLKQLLLQSTWKVTSEAELNLTQQRVFNLIDLFACSADLPFSCPYDLTVGEQGFGFAIDSNLTPTNEGFFSVGSGWVCTQNAINSAPGHSVSRLYVIKVLDTPVHVSHAKFTFNLTKGIFTDGGYQNGWDCLLGGTEVAGVLTADASTQPDGVQVVDVDCGGALVDTFSFYMNASAYSSLGTPGNVVFSDFEIIGTGDSPC